MRKKLLCLIMSFAIALSIPVMCALTAGAEDIASVVFEGKTYEVASGDTFVFETKLSMPERAAAGGRVIIRFDRDIIELVRNVDGSIYETDLGDVLTVGDYTADGTGCSFAFAGTQYSLDNVLDGDKNVLVRFLFRAKSAGRTEIKFDSDLYDFSVFNDFGDNTPVAVVSSGKTTADSSGYNFIGNVITVREIENYQEYGELPTSGETTPPVEENSESESASTAEENSSESSSVPVNSGDQSEVNDNQNVESSENVGSSGSFVGIAAIAFAVVVVIAVIICVCVVLVKKNKTD